MDKLNGTNRTHSIYMHSVNWVEIGVAAFGPITADVVTFSQDLSMFTEQQRFLRKHDKLLKRLWFLWNHKELQGKIAADRSKSAICGCVGGCRFFGNNTNGVRFFTTQLLDAGEKRFGRYGSESIWGGANERPGIAERLQQMSGVLSTMSMPESSLRLRKGSELSTRKSGSALARVRSFKGEVISN